VERALGCWDNPAVSPATMKSLLSFSRGAGRMIKADWEQVSYRIVRQNALQALIPTTPDWQTS
jgi:hypothetical protein